LLLGFLVLAFITLLGACTISTDNFRISPQPPDFTYIPKERIQSTMWVLAAEVRDVDEWVRIAGSQPNPSIDARIRASLDRMRSAARRLDRPGQSTQHPVLNQHLGDFLRRLDGARRAIDASPPDRSQAAALAGGCYLCHGTTLAAAPSGDSR